MTKPTAVITGATGILGQAFRRNLSSDHTVISLSRQPPPGADWLQIDYSRESVEQVHARIGNPTQIVHCAGVPSVFASLRDPVTDHRNNFDPLLFTLELARRTGAQVTLISSAEVYGDVVRPSEDVVPDPQNFYGLNKLFGERYLRLYAKQFQTRFQILRPSIIYGPNLKRNVLFDLTSSFAKRNPQLRLFCTLDSELDFITGDEVAHAARFIQSLRMPQETWNVPSGEPMVVRDLFEWFCTHFNHRPTVEVVEQNFQKKLLNNEKIKRHGWQPRKSFLGYLKEFVDAYQG